MLKNDILQCDHIFGEKGEVELKEKLTTESGSKKNFIATFLSKASIEKKIEGRLNI